MWAGERLNHGETEPVFCDIDSHPMYVTAHGHTAPISVVVTEDSQGRYWGWLSNTNRDRTAPATYETYPAMIFEHEGLLSMCFPAGHQYEADRNAGRVLRLSIRDVSASAP